MIFLLVRSSVMGKFLVSLRQNEDGVEYFCHNNIDSNEIKDILYDYFRLDLKIADKYNEWAQKDPNFGKKCKTMSGIRMLRQDPLETIFSFICSANNHISRISKMVIFS